mmetsp:Transcript_28592/g.59782  ORF Transcript_28592/g.59782 Transcript_28592/m.59782 type:complete len:88 (+) Transcript_28592:870-1133(+)
MGNNTAAFEKSGAHLERERDALQFVKNIRQEEHMRIAHKQKKHEMFLRKQLLDELHNDLIQSIVEPLRMWTESGLLSHTNACGGSRR